MEMTMDNLIEVLTDYFGVNQNEGSYVYELTRAKSAFQVGTMSFDDFEEFNEESINALATHLWDSFSK